jgi:uncharacterized integral membrane protein
MSDDSNDSIRPIDDVPVSRVPARQYTDESPGTRIPDEPGFVRRNFGAIVWAIVLVLLAIFIGQNWKEVKIEALFWSFTIALSWALIAAAIFGIILGWLVPIIWKRSRRKGNAN